MNRCEIIHVWKDAKFSGEGPTHSAQMVIDGVSYLTDAVCTIGAQPSKALTDWVADWAAPSYWKPNIEIIVSFANFNKNQRKKIVKYVFLCRIVMDVKRILSALVCISIIVGHVVKDFVIHVQCIKCQYRREDGLTQCVSAIHAKTFCQKNVMHGLVRAQSFSYLYTKKISFYCLLSILFMKLPYQLNQTTTKNIEIFLKKMLLNPLQIHPQAHTTVSIRMTKIFVFENMVKSCIILCHRWLRCLNIQKVISFLPFAHNFHDSSCIVFKYISDLIKDSARPSYWVPDKDREANFCCVCTKPFGSAEELISNAKKQITNGQGDMHDSSEMIGSNICDRRRHHCRSCGQAVCDGCSQNRRPVPERGWNTDVRVCDVCNKKSPAT